MGLPVVILVSLFVLYQVARFLWEYEPVLAVSVPSALAAGIIWLLWPAFTMPMNLTDPEYAARAASSQRGEAVLVAVFLISLLGVLFGLARLFLSRRNSGSRSAV